MVHPDGKGFHDASGAAPAGDVAALVRENRILAALGRAETLEEALTVVGEALHEIAPVDGYLFNLLDETGHNLVCEKVQLPGDYGHVEETYYNFKFPLDAPDANVACFEQRRPLLVTQSNVDDYPGTTRTRFYRWQIRSLLAVPLLSAGRCIGTLMVFSQDELLDARLGEPLQRALAGYGEILHNVLRCTWIRRKQRLIENADRERREFLRFITKVNNIDSRDRICEVIAAEFLRRTDFDLVGVATREGDRLVLRHLSTSGLSAKHTQQLRDFYRDHPFVIDQGDGAIPTAFVQNAPLFFPDTREVLHLPMSPKDQGALGLIGTPRTVFICPIRRKEQPIGALWLVSVQRPVPMSEEEKSFVQMLCSFIGTAMGNAELYEIIGRQNAEIEALNADLQGKVTQLGELASTDRLTGLHNFGFLEHELERRVSEYERSPDVPLSLVIFDVDHFKHFNDTYGHLAGNEVLQRVARCLQRLARKMDIACRYGGEEFVVILPRCDAEGACGFAERVRRELLTVPLYPAEPDLLVTVSAGCATYAPGEDAAGFLDRADRALYRAKAEGRNRVVSAEPGS